MSIDNLIKDIDNLENGLNRKIEIAARDTMSLMVKRIFTDGINSAGSKIGIYKTKPIYISKDQMPDKSKGEKGKTGRAKKTKFFSGGYKQFKSASGLTDKVNLRVFGSLLRDFAGADVVISKKGQKKQKEPIPEPTKLGFATYAIVLKNKVNILKRAGLESKYGTIFNLTRREIAQFNKTFSKL